MNIYWTTFLVLALCLSDQIFQLTTAEEEDDHYVNEWAAEIPGGWHAAKRVAENHGYELIRAIEGIPDHYALKRSDVPHRSRRSAHHHTRRLSDDSRVTFVEQQQQKTRTKRDVDLDEREAITKIINEGGNLDDPDLEHEWYLNQQNSDTNRRDSVRADLRVKEVWKKGITGKNIVVTILDDGIENTHTDLAPNYDPQASFDLNANDTDPFPRYDITNENKHGTRCAGEVAMMANNGKCGVGIAFNSKIGGIRMLDGRVTDHLEGDALSFNKNYVDIYSSSWGPTDNGKTTEKPGPLASKALELGAMEGRNGKGSIFAWASGNGGRMGDNCNSDGYTSSIYTMSVSSASQSGTRPWYGERCSSTLTTAYSSGSSSEGKVISADLHDKCTNAHTGTSAAAPMAAGVLALLLEANPDLTWRDVQHIVVHTSRTDPLALEKGWYQNAAGYCVNLAFGFGLMDALAMVELADPKTWKNVPEQHKCVVEPVDSTDLPKSFSSGETIEIEFKTDGCKGTENEINFLEHIQFIINADHEERGNIYAEVTSPMGTITTLMLERSHDKSRSGFKNWPLMSVHNWGEQPQGLWKFRISDRTDDNKSGKLKSVQLVMYGTKEQPEHQKKMPQGCSGPDDVAGTAIPTISTIPETKVQQTVDTTLDKLKTLLNDKNMPSNSGIVSSLQKMLDSLKAANSKKGQSKDANDKAFDTSDLKALIARWQ